MKPMITCWLVLLLQYLAMPAQAQYNAYRYQSAPPAAAPNKVPIYAGLGTVILAGSGLMVAGFVKRTDALDLKTAYDEHTDPSDPFYTDLGQTRDEFGDAYKKDLKTSNILIYGGAGVVALGAGILINRIIWIKRIERAKAGRSGCRPSFENLRWTVTCSSGASGTGLGLSYRF